MKANPKPLGPAAGSNIPEIACSASVVGTRTAVWGPMPDAALSHVVVLDEHDEAMQAEQAPTWHARDVAMERARRAGARCTLVSSTPTLEALAAATLTVPRSSSR